MNVCRSVQKSGCLLCNLKSISSLTSHQLGHQALMSIKVIEILEMLYRHQMYNLDSTIKHPQNVEAKIVGIWKAKRKTNPMMKSWTWTWAAARFRIRTWTTTRSLARIAVETQCEQLPEVSQWLWSSWLTWCALHGSTAALHSSRWRKPRSQNKGWTLQAKLN